MSTTPQIPALPGTSPLGLSSEPKVALAHLDEGALFMQATNACRVIKPYGDTVQIAYIKAHEGAAHIGTMPGSTLVRVVQAGALNPTTAMLLRGAVDLRAAQLNAAANKRRDALNAFRLGQRVSFDGGAKGIFLGTVTRISLKTATVAVENSALVYRVTPGLLRDASLPGDAAARARAESRQDTVDLAKVRLTVSAMGEAEFALFRAAIAERAAL